MRRTKKPNFGLFFGESIEGVGEKLELPNERAVKNSTAWEKDNEDLEANNVSSWRLVPFFIIVALVLLILVGQAFKLQIINGANFLSQSEGNHVLVKVNHAPRGVIYDRTGKVLARNKPGFRIAIRKIDLPAAWEGKVSDVAKLVNLKPADLIDKIKKAKTDSVTLATDLNNDQVITLKTNQDKYSWLDVEIYPEREYLYAEATAPLLGYTSEATIDDLRKTDLAPYSAGDQVGKSGAEASFESELRGANGYNLTKIDSTGKSQGTLFETQPLAGNDITLSIDANLQKFVYDALVQSLKDKGGEGGSVVVMKPGTGEILALASVPSYDDNIFSGPLTSAAYSQLINNSGHPLLNRPIASSYPPGSTFKLFVGTAALENNTIAKETKITDTGFITLGDVTFNNWLWLESHKTDGDINIVRALARSNDTFFYKVGQSLGVDKIAAQAKEFGFGESTGIELPGETFGVTPTPKWKQDQIGQVWFPGDTINYAIGQGYMLSTPLQLARATAVFANGGKLVNATILKTDKPRVERENFLKPDNIETIRQGMYENTLGDGNVAFLFRNYRLKTAGKTGSAQAGGDYLPDAWYTGFAPFDNPQIVVTVMFERGGHGADLSAPLTKKIFDYYLK